MLHCTKLMQLSLPRIPHPTSKAFLECPCPVITPSPHPTSKAFLECPCPVITPSPQCCHLRLVELARLALGTMMGFRGSDPLWTLTHLRQSMSHPLLIRLIPCSSVP